jgi:hypothetical protein
MVCVCYPAFQVKCLVQLLPAFHDQLDFISVHDGLLAELKSALESVRGRHSLESQVDIIVNAKAPGVKEYRALAKVRIDATSILVSSFLRPSSATSVLPRPLEAPPSRPSPLCRRCG